MNSSNGFIPHVFISVVFIPRQQNYPDNKKTQNKQLFVPTADDKHLFRDVFVSLTKVPLCLFSLPYQTA